MKRTLIAAAVLAVASGSAFAHVKDPYLFNATIVGEQVGIVGWVTLYGCVDIGSTAGAVVNNTQNVYSAGISLTPTAAPYTSGTIKTTYDNTYTSTQGGGYAYGGVTKTQSSSQRGASGFSAGGSYAYGQQSSEVSGGGYEYSQQAAGVKGGGYEYSQQSSGLGGSFYSQQQSQGGHISAGGHAGGSVSYTAYNGKHSGYDSFSAGGGFSAGYNESSYNNGSGIGGYFETTQGSGQGKQWGYEASEGSGQGQQYGYQASQGSGWGEVSGHSSGYKESSSTWSSGFAALWGIDSTLDTTYVNVSGTMVQHLDNQPLTTLTATTGSGALSGASGNIGLNIAEGVNNAQSNDASLAAVDAGNVFGNAQIFNVQSATGSVTVKNYALNATVGSDTLQSATGNVGVNVASGVSNAQNNSLAASTTSGTGNASTYAMVATDQTQQTAATNFNGSFAGTAMLGSGALADATGNIGVNIAGGVGNVQHNGLAIAAMSIQTTGNK